MVRVSNYLMKKYCPWYNYCQRNPRHWDREERYPACAAQFGCFSQEEWNRLRPLIGLIVDGEAASI